MLERGKRYLIALKGEKAPTDVLITGSMDFDMGCELLDAFSQGEFSLEETILDALSAGYIKPDFYTGRFEKEGKPWTMIFTEFQIQTIAEGNPFKLPETPVGGK